MAAGHIQVYSLVAEAIKARIAAGDWAVGQRLPTINQLAQEFGAGIGSIREAVKALASLGVIRIEHGRGMFVASAQRAQVEPYEHFLDVGAGSVLALCEARRILEPELAAFAAERGTNIDLHSIREQALAMERLVGEGLDFSEPDLQFHRQIALAAHNPVLAHMMAGVNDLLRESQKITREQAMTQRAVRYHLLIADAVCEHNPLQARLLMLAHVNDAINSVLAWQANTHNEQRTIAQANVSPMVLPQRSLTPSL
jgi:GntR family transcriptional regulator, transcriptional repressor for pyruvate dehydrogenase complex